MFAEDHNLECQIIEKEEMVQRGMGGIAQLFNL